MRCGEPAVRVGLVLSFEVAMADTKPMQIVTVWARPRRQATCRGCGAPISFRQVVASGKWLPFDGDPVALRTRQDVETGRLVEDLDASDVHFRSCPNSADFRRR